MRLLANTGFLFADLPFPERLAAASAAGFDGVEFHDEVQRHDASGIAAALDELGLTVGGLNIRMGDSFGCAALPGHEADFIADLTAAHVAAVAVGAGAIHVLAGRGAGDEAVFRANLRRALDATDRLILIEPICAEAVPGYHLSRLDHGLELADLFGPRVRVMFDWFHAATELGPQNAAEALARHTALIGHVQAASCPGRNEPEPEVLHRFADTGCTAAGLEYRPLITPADHLARLRAAGI
ncbi:MULTISPECIES: TIM barrel protein [unclassified Paracoccus (in: a-proteobacteria)]|uniref:TIM barrel protein n=1 Tax=unclassified Paracoccus (in: a-proteobacteria) TaxID=2688777 RepID=UPI000225F834|nr:MULTISPECIES: TIM barrel protein [unclassified Paracoccus (in: a-proteobacteria)]SMG54532.1 hydroxypyruvate isomerase [Paracoccus sp. J56]